MNIKYKNIIIIKYGLLYPVPVPGYIKIYS